MLPPAVVGTDVSVLVLHIAPISCSLERYNYKVMLSSRNRRLKRFSRFVAFFVIVFSGCVYRFNKIYENFKEYTGSDEFLEKSPIVPPFVKEINRQRKQADIRKMVLGVRLPPEDENELRYRNGLALGQPGKLDKET